MFSLFKKEFSKKNLLILSFILFSSFSIIAAPWCDCHVYVKAVKEDGSIGGGWVFVSRLSDEQTTARCTYRELRRCILGNSHNTGNFPCAVYLAAKPDDGWEFDYWECTKREGTYYPNLYSGTSVGTKLYTPLPAKQKACVSKRGGTNTGADGQTTTEATDTNAIWIAHFKRAAAQTVKVASEQTSLGTANIDKVTNYVDDQVTITAWCGNASNNPRSENIMFLGWYRLNETTGEKDLVTRDNIYTFTITEANKGTYYARFASDYYFWRIKNNKYNNYLTAVAKYTGSVSASAIQTALQTQLSFNDDLAASITDEGSMMKVWVSSHQPNTGKEVWDIYVQDEHTNQYYDANTISQGTFLQVTHNSDNTYIFNGNNNSFYLYEKDNKMTGGVTLLESAYWRLEGMDKDLTTKENYFAVDPSEFIGPDSEGKYWTTLRVCFNMLYETSEITPYIVTAADATTGTMELTEVTGGIIPEKTCVLLKCNSTDVTRNVMIPTTSTSSFNTSGNLLTSSTYYYKNQSVSSSLNLKGIKLVDGRIGFGGSTLTKVDGNRAYLPIASDVSIIPPYISTTLAALIASGDTQHTYIITDLTGVDVVDHDRILICKDNNGYADKDEISENYIDFMHTATGLAIDVPATYDQSNWIGLRLPEGEELTSVVFGSPLKGVVGKLVDTVNPEFQLIQMPEATTGTPASTNLNPFIAASFYGANHQTGNNNKVYFFVQPKPMELANIEMAQWDGTKFITPVHDAAHPNWNTAELTGGFEFNGSYMTNVDMSVLQTGHSYKMTPSLIKLKTINNPTHVYVLGNVNGLDWSPMKGVEMFTNDGNVYTATLTVKDVNNGYGYFSFSKKLNTDWEGDNGILNYRFGAVANGNNYTIFDNLLNQQLPLSEMGQTKSFEIASGTYSLTVNLQNKTLVVKPATTQAPRLNEASNKSYVVYPLSLTKVTTTQDGVITEVADISSKQVAGVKYYNLAGIESSEPHQGVNIVVTTYTDGSRSSAKVLR